MAGGAPGVEIVQAAGGTGEGRGLPALGQQVVVGEDQERFAGLMADRGRVSSAR